MTHLAAYVCARCHGELVPHPGGNWSCDYHGYRCKRVSKRRLAEQIVIAAQEHPVAVLTMAQLARIRAALYGGYDD